MRNLSSVVLAMSVVLLAGCTLARYLPDEDSSSIRHKRQVGDIQFLERLAKEAMRSKACTQTGCGLDIDSLGKRKRSDSFRSAEETQNGYRLRLLQSILTALSEDNL